MLTAPSLDAAAIAVDASNPVLAFAADELRRHLAVGGGAGNIGAAITCDEGENDAFTVTVGEDSLQIRGDNPRGVMNGVYWLLEQIGHTWVEPGKDGSAFVPGKSLAEGEYRQVPSFPRRTLILGQDALHDEWSDWMEWASRNRYNDIFFHDTPPSVWDRGGKHRPATAEELDADRKGWLFERWDADGERIIAEARRRGLTLQFGGHHLPTLVPPEEFERHPDWFPVRNGARDPKYNLCTATPELHGYLARRTEAFLERFPGADIYHMWGDDIRGGGWCNCATCGAMSASDQALLATNLMAETVARVLPGAKVAHLAYHDTLEPPTIEPRENVTALFAPRERCYAHAIDDAACQRNRPDYWEPFTRFAGLFPAGRMQVFEYYSDAILFKGLAPTHLQVLPRDAQAYASAGVWNMGNLMVGDRPWVGPPWHAWWTARCLWDAQADANADLALFCAAVDRTNTKARAQDTETPPLPRSRERGPGGEGAPVAYYRTAGEAYRQILELHDLEPLPRHDVLDYSDTPRRTLTAKAAELRRAAEDLASLAGDTTLHEAERTQADFVAALAAHLAHRLTAWDAAHKGDRAHEGDRAHTLSALAAAETALAQIHAWDAQHNTPAYAVISRPMRRAMAYHLAQIRALLG
ncbi:MAG: DUF4838 domain-containing protein [Dehalococcoidia bacterium]